MSSFHSCQRDPFCFTVVRPLSLSHCQTSLTVIFVSLVCCLNFCFTVVKPFYLSNLSDFNFCRILDRLNYLCLSDVRRYQLCLTIFQTIISVTVVRSLSLSCCQTDIFALLLSYIPLSLPRHCWTIIFVLLLLDHFLCLTTDGLLPYVSLFHFSERVAIKILDKTKLDQKTQRLLSREISSMERLHHPNIIRLYEVVETLAKLHIIMEYAGGGELFHKISNEGRLPETEAKPLFAQITAAISHMVSIEDTQGLKCFLHN